MPFHRAIVVLSLMVLLFPAAPVHSQPNRQLNNNTSISMIMYPVEKDSDGVQYLITPTGNRVHIPGLGIAPNATQVQVFRDQSEHFWYTNTKGQPTAVTEEQLDWARQQINRQSGVPSAMANQNSGQGYDQGNPPAQLTGNVQGSYYSRNQQFSGGYNGMPYGTPINMGGQGKYYYDDPNGDRQYVSPQNNAQMNNWQKQVPWDHRMGNGPFPVIRGNRADRLGSRSSRQAGDEAEARARAEANWENGNPVAAGMRSRQAGRKERRSNRSERRADRLSY